MKLFRNYARNVQGSFSVYLSIAVLVLIMGIGCAYDMSQITAHKSRLSDLADNTALAAAIEARNKHNDRKAAAESFFDENKHLSGNIKVDNEPNIQFNDSSAEVTVTVSAKVEYFLMGMFGFSDPTMQATSRVGYLIDDLAPLSIAFAFDRSGSMSEMAGTETKMSALQTATGDLFDAVEDASERPDLLVNSMSTAFSSYNEALVDTSPMSTGYSHVITEVNNMTPDGWTNMGPSLQYALGELDGKKASVSDSRWAGYVVFMTDGKNDADDPTLIPVWDADTLAQCDALKAQSYQVFAVAFAAPPEGEAILQQCASSPTHYFDSNNNQDLKKAFKIIGERIGSATIRVKA